MQYLITFLEGIVSFISPCVLPLLPVYISYFAGNRKEGEQPDMAATLVNTVSFVAGFSLVFSLMGVFSGAVSNLLSSHGTMLNIVCGAIVVIFGLSYLGIIKLPDIRNVSSGGHGKGPAGSFIFGIIYSVTISPCAGAFLGSALMLAGTSGGAMKGFLLLLCYSLGFGIPFIMSGLLIDRLEGAFDVIKKNYRVINIISGSFLIIMGVLMMTGHLGKWMALLS